MNIQPFTCHQTSQRAVSTSFIIIFFLLLFFKESKIAIAPKDVYLSFCKIEENTKGESMSCHLPWALAGNACNQCPRDHMSDTGSSPGVAPWSSPMRFGLRWLIVRGSHCQSHNLKRIGLIVRGSQGVLGLNHPSRPLFSHHTAFLLNSAWGRPL